MGDRLDNIKKKLKKYNQEHLLMFYNKMNEEEKEKLLEQLENIDFDLMSELYESTKQPLDLKDVTIEPIEHTDKSKMTVSERESYEEKGIEAKTADWCADNVVYGGEYKPFGFATAETLETKSSAKWIVKETDEYKSTYVAVKIKSYSIRTVAKCVSEYLAHESNRQ